MDCLLVGRLRITELTLLCMPIPKSVQHTGYAIAVRNLLIELHCAQIALFCLRIIL